MTEKDQNRESEIPFETARLTPDKDEFRETHESLRGSKAGEELTPDSQPKQPTDLSIPESITDRWRFIEAIGEGGMSAVHLAKHAVSGKLAAVKVLKTQYISDQIALLRFQQEAKTANYLSHPNIVSVFECGVSDDGRAYIVMEFVRGHSLAETMKQVGNIDPQRAVNLFRQIAVAVGHAHKHGIIHRDLKPSNVMLTETASGKDTVKVVDFGLAKLVSAPSGMDLQLEQEHLTQTGAFVGTPLYMSPEQCTGQPLTARTDIYSMGCLMYAALTGSPPLVGVNPLETMHKHVTELPRPITESKSAENMLFRLNGIILKCLEKRPDRRYQSMDELFEDLNAVTASTSVWNFLQQRRESKTRKVARVAVVVGSCLVVGLVSALATAVLERDHGWQWPPLGTAGSQRPLVGPIGTQSGVAPGAPPDVQSGERQLVPTGKHSGAPPVLSPQSPVPDGNMKDSEQALNLDEAQRLWMQGKSLAKRREFGSAILKYNEAARLNPHHEWVYLDRAKAYGELNAQDEELDDLTKAWQYNSTDRRYYISDAFGQYYFSQGDWKKAIDWYHTTEEFLPSDSWAPYWIGRSLFHLKDYSKAEQELKKAIRLNPKDAEPLRELGRELRAQGKLQEADKYVKQADAVLAKRNR